MPLLGAKIVCRVLLSASQAQLRAGTIGSQPAAQRRCCFFVFRNAMASCAAAGTAAEVLSRNRSKPGIAKIASPKGGSGQGARILPLHANKQVNHELDDRSCDGSAHQLA